MCHADVSQDHISTMATAEQYLCAHCAPLKLVVLHLKTCWKCMSLRTLFCSGYFFFLTLLEGPYLSWLPREENISWCIVLSQLCPISVSAMVYKTIKGKMHSKIISSDLIGFFCRVQWRRSEVKIRTAGRRSNRQKNWHVQACVTSVVPRTSPSCTIMRAIQNAHDQPGSVRRWPAVGNLIRPVKLKTILQPRVLDAWHQWRIPTGRIVVAREFLAIFGRLFDRVLVRILTSNLHHRTQQKKSLQDQRLWFWSVVFLLNWS